MSFDPPSRVADRWPRSGLELGGVVLLGALLRFHRLDAESLWFDELFSATVVRTLTTPQILFQLPLSESHPPLYFALLRWWTRLVGSSEFAVRSLSVLFGVAAIGLLYAVAREVFDESVALVAALVLAVSPFHVEFSQQARMYSLFTLLTLASYYALVRLRTDDGGTYGYLLATCLLVYTHVFGLFVVLAQNVYVVLAHLLPTDRTPPVGLRRWARLQALTGLLASPWVAVLLARVVGISGGGDSPISWIPEPGLVSLFATPVRYVTQLRYFVGGQRGPSFPLVVLLLLVVAGLLVLALFRLLPPVVARLGGGSRTGACSDADRGASSLDGALLLLSWATVPVLVPFVLSYLVTPVFVHRYTTAASLPFYVLIAKGVRSVRRDPLRYLLVGVLVVGLVAPLPTYYDAAQQEQWREATQYVESHVDGDDVVVHATDPSRVATREMLETDPSAYYLPERVRMRTVPLGADASRLGRIARGHDRVLVVVSRGSDRQRARFLARLDGSRERCGHRSYVGLETYCFE